jgi:hypothetical protein
LRTDPDFDVHYEAICRVLEVFYNDPTFCPRYEVVESQEDPPKDFQKVKMNRIESSWEWRSRVTKAMRRMDELYDWEKIWFRRYLTHREHFGFWKFYMDGVWIPEVNGAVRKIYRNMDKGGCFWG